MLRALVWTFVALVCGASVARAAWIREPDGPIATDRPGNGNAATAVTRGHVNVELGVLYARGGAESHLVSFPTLLRLGVIDRVEARLGYGIVGLSRAAETSRADPTDLSVGTKLQALVAEGGQPDLSLSFDLFLPTGDGAFTNDAVVPESRLLAAWALPASLGLLLNAGFDLPEDSAGERYARVLYVANLGYAPIARAGAFAELFGLQGLGDDRESVVQLDWGAYVQLSDDLQLDFFLQHGLSDAAIRLQVSFGVSGRL